MVKNNQGKTDIFYLVRKDEYPDKPEHSNYQKAEITVFVSVGIPSTVSNGMFTLTYQRNYEKELNGMTHWYGETMENINDPRFDKLKTISEVFGKMEKYLLKIREKGLTLETSRQDDLNWRIALLKKIGAYPVDWNKEQRAYSSYDYFIKTKESIRIEA
jgi:hypothetical protein